MASVGAAIGWDQLHTGVVTQSAPWISVGDEVGQDTMIFYSVGARVRTRAYTWLLDRNSISIDIYGRGSMSSSSAEGYKRLSVEGKRGFGNNYSYSDWTKLWYDGSSISSSDDAQSNRCDFWVISPVSSGGDDSAYCVETTDLRCFPKGTFNSYSAQCGDTIKGRGWYTDRWWSMARISYSYTGTEGAPINSVFGETGYGSMPIFSSVRIAMSYAVSWTGTYITPATADACHPSLQTF